MSGYNLPDDVPQADVDRAAWDSEEPFDLGPVDVVALQEILDGLLASVAEESYDGRLRGMRGFVAATRLVRGAARVPGVREANLPELRIGALRSVLDSDSREMCVDDRRGRVLREVLGC